MRMAAPSWSTVADELADQHPFLNQLRIVSKDAAPECIPKLVWIMGIVGSALLSGTSSNPLLTVGPRSYGFSFWIAFVSSLDTITTDYKSALADPPPLRPGRVLLDGESVVEFDGESEEWLHLSMAGGATRIRRDQRLRLQPTYSHRSMDFISIKSSPPPDLLDSLFGIRAYRNRKIFNNRVILVGNVGRHERLLQTRLTASGHLPEDTPRVRDLIQCGKLKRDGAIEHLSSGQIECEPTLLLASDLTVVREYIRRTEQMPLIVLDGAPTWRNRAEALSSIQMFGGHLMLCLEHKENIEIPSSWTIDFWPWTSSELGSLTGERCKSGGIFSGFHSALDIYSERSIDVRLCHDPTIEETYNQIKALEPFLRSDETVRLQRSLFDYFLLAARATCPILHSEDMEQTFEIRIKRILQSLEDSRWALTAGVVSAVESLCLQYMDVMQRNDTGARGKVRTIESLLRSSYPETVTVITAGSWEVALARNYFEERLRLTTDRVRFHSYGDIDDCDVTDNLIVCGWLNSARMRRLLSACVAKNITLLLYPFENAWYESAEKSWLREARLPLVVARQAELLGLSESRLPALIATEEEQISGTNVPSSIDSDLGDFELAVRFRQLRLPLQHAKRGEQMVEAFPVLFAGDQVAYLTASYELPLATEFIRGEADESDELTLRTVSQLEIGDYVIFRHGTQSDLIRETADIGLKRQKRLGARKTAALWREALHQFHHSHAANASDLNDPKTLRRTINALRAGGLNRTEQTLRWWLDEENSTIGPQHESDIEQIAAITGNLELKERISDVREAIKEVRGAHSQAASHLVKCLFSTLRARIADLDPSSTMYFDIEGLGRAVVSQVELLYTDPLSVPYSLVNRLLSEDEL